MPWAPWLAAAHGSCGPGTTQGFQPRISIPFPDPAFLDFPSQEFNAQQKPLGISERTATAVVAAAAVDNYPGTRRKRVNGSRHWAGAIPEIRVAWAQRAADAAAA